jgi:hypothetical protein
MTNAVVTKIVHTPPSGYSQLPTSVLTALENNQSQPAGSSVATTTSSHTWVWWVLGGLAVVGVLYYGYKKGTS